MKRSNDPVEVAAYLLPLILIINGLGVPYLLTLNLIFGALIVSLPEIRRSGWTYLVLAACWAPELVLRWYRYEDHVYMGVYWCLAVGFARLSVNPSATLRTSARWLIGLGFTFSIIGKLRAPEFMDSTLFHYILLEDARFRTMLAETIGRLDADMVRDNLAMLATLNRWDAAGELAALHFPPRIGLLAHGMTAWTLAIESALALTFLAPNRNWLARWRHPVLIAFCLGTYLVAPIIGFGCLFLGMGAVLCRPDQARLRLTYVWLYFAVFAWFIVRALTLSSGPPV